jgi:hypothetical protein
MIVVASSEVLAQPRARAGKAAEAWEVPQDSAAPAQQQGDTWLARLRRNLRAQEQPLAKELARLAIRQTEESKSEEEGVAVAAAPARSRLEEDVRRRLATQSAGKLLKELHALLE